MNYPKFLLLAAIAVSSLSAIATRRMQLLDEGWNFSYIPDSTSDVKPYSKVVDLPHDWSVEMPFSKNTSSGMPGGYVYTGKGNYHKEINLTPDQLKGSIYSLLIEGAYERWKLMVNGDTVGFHPYGYTSAIFNITPYLKDGKNSIEIAVDNSNQKNSRWYSGSGLYRHVRLIRTGETHIAPWSLYITTPEVNNNEAKVKVSFDVEGFDKSNPLNSEITIYDPAGNKVDNVNVHISDKPVEAEIVVPSPRLWSNSTPALYSMEVSLLDNGKEVDKIKEHFGIRTISFSPDEGFRLNGVPMKLTGACVHHDHGLLGAASFDAAEARKVRLLKEAGFNAVRTSHNPPSPAFLNECDRQGLLVIDEAFDGWRDGKNDNDYHLWIDEWGTKDIADMVRRDRNHPSIIAWSIGNEILELKKIEVITTARKFAGLCRKLDPTRPVTEALYSWDGTWEINDPHAENLDIVGYNYVLHWADEDHKRCPERIMWQTESFPHDAALNWHRVMEHPYVIGDFVWTGIDYLGESGIGRYFYTGQPEGESWQNEQWPWHGAYCGDIDITGWRKPVSHYRQLLYDKDKKLYMAVREPNGYNGEVRTTMWGVWPTWESWNWAGHEGKPIEVEVISRYPEIRLYLDNELIGKKKADEMTDFMAKFTLPYKTGDLKAVGFDDDGIEQESIVIRTTGKPAGIRLTPDKTVFSADGQDLIFVIAEIIDAKGNIVPDAALPVDFSVKGDATILAAGSADLTSTEPYASPSARTWKGRAMAVVRAGKNLGNVTISATSPKLRQGIAKIKGI